MFPHKARLCLNPCAVANFISFTISFDFLLFPTQHANDHCLKFQSFNLLLFFFGIFKNEVKFLFLIKEANGKYGGERERGREGRVEITELRNR